MIDKTKSKYLPNLDMTTSYGLGSRPKRSCSSTPNMVFMPYESEMKTVVTTKAKQLAEIVVENQRKKKSTDVTENRKRRSMWDRTQRFIKRMFYCGA